MQNLYDKLKEYSEAFDDIQSGKGESCPLPGQTYYLKDGSILCIPRPEGDNRFPYGENGFNFWTYASGYMHANDGLFSPFLRAAEGQEPKIAFFAGDKKGRVLSLLAVPVLNDENFGEVKRFTVFTESCTYYVTETKEASFVIRVFVDNNNRMYFSLAAVNNCEEEKEFFVSVYMNPYLSHSICESSEDRWFRKCEYRAGEEKALGTFVFTINEDLSRTESISNFGVLNQMFEGENASLQKVDVTTSRKQFVGGGYSNLQNAVALKEGKLQNPAHVTAFTDIAVCAELLHIKFAPKGRGNLELNLGYLTNSKDGEAYKSLIGAPGPTATNECIRESEETKAKEEKSLSCRFRGETEGMPNAQTMTHFFRSLKKQVEFCASIKGYVQLTPNSLIGIRDVFQAIEGALYYRPKEARTKMLEAFDYLTPTGRFPRQYGLPKHENALPPMDLRQFIDQGCWVVDTVISYLKFTGDFEFLKEKCGYYEIVDESKRLVRKSNRRDSVLEHLLQVMEYLIQAQDEETGCIHILYGDWNDALDGLGVSQDAGKEFGTGVSVMVSLQVYRNLCQMIELLSNLGGYHELISRYEQAAKCLEKGLFTHAVLENAEGEKRIVHGWGDDRAYYVGSFEDPDGESRYGLTSNAFWVLAGLYEKEPSLGEVILKAYDKLDSKYGCKTFEPAFFPNAKGVGRIYKLPPGTAENGACYIHATAFAIMSLFEMGEGKAAWQQLAKILPFLHEKSFCSPYVMPNSYGYNPSLNIDGESMQDWQTGSSNVVLKALLRYVLGFRPEYHGITLQPAGWCPFEKYSYEIEYRGKRMKIQYQNIHSGKRRFYLDGKEMLGERNETLKIDVLSLAKEILTDGMQIQIQD